MRYRKGAALIRSMLQMATSDVNLPSNRERMLAHLVDLSALIRGDIRGEVFSSIVPLAKGDFANEEREGALRSRFGSLDIVQAIALICLARIFGSDASMSSEVQRIVDDALTDQRATIHRGAYAAARGIPGLSDQSIAAVILGTRDPDSVVASSAFAALSERLEWQLIGPLWRQFLLTVQLASHSPSVALRREAALALVRRLSKVTEPELRLQALKLIPVFATDVAASVRNVVKNLARDN